jgi:hypothetical protein
MMAGAKTDQVVPAWLFTAEQSGVHDDAAINQCTYTGEHAISNAEAGIHSSAEGTEWRGHPRGREQRGRGWRSAWQGGVKCEGRGGCG